MRISNAEVSMASNVSYSASSKVDVSTIYKPCINFNGIQLIQDGNKVTTGSNAEGTSETEGTDFLSSFNYSLDKKGQLKELDNVGTTTGNSSTDNFIIRMKSLSYLLRKILFGDTGEMDDYMSELWSNAFSSSGNMLVTETTNVSYEEYQSMDFAAEGKVITEDGRELSFNYSFSMSSSFKAQYSQTVQSMQSIAMIDPLVINLNSNPKEISDQKFYFDLNCDGEDEEISTLGAGRGFLALDKNGDGKINDGSELFGTKSGDGFKDLAIYDEDGNGWIDENDSIFEKLRVWTVNEKGESELYTLKQSDVGAICLNKVNTDFISYDKQHEALGAIRNTGIYLRESTGQAQAVQHIDLAT